MADSIAVSPGAFAPTRVGPSRATRLRRVAAKNPLGVVGAVLILLVLLAAVAGFLAWRGIGRGPSTKFTPEETIASVKEEVAWAKSRLLRRG